MLKYPDIVCEVGGREGGREGRVTAVVCTPCQTVQCSAVSLSILTRVHSLYTRPVQSEALHYTYIQSAVIS